MNVWVVNFNGQSASGGLIGVTTQPGGDPQLDGIVVLYTTVGGNNFPGTFSPYNLGRTLTHEVGHWFDLIHTWGDDITGSCAGSDSVADTPNQANENYGCPHYPFIDNCTPTLSGTMFMNYMNYVDDHCMNIFTQGQSTRMHNAITALRPTIPFSNGCLAPNGIAEVNPTILNFNLFPNPGSGDIRVLTEFSERTDAAILVSNMIGETVYRKEFKNVLYVNLLMDLSEKAQGVYNLSLTTTHAYLNKKITLTR
jgi:hypothetical protein